MSDTPVQTRRWRRIEYGRLNIRARHGWSYRAALSLGPEEHIAPLAVPSARILVADLLP